MNILYAQSHPSSLCALCIRKFIEHHVSASNYALFSSSQTDANLASHSLREACVEYIAWHKIYLKREREREGQPRRTYVCGL